MKLVVCNCRCPAALRTAISPVVMSDSAVSDVVWRQGYYETLGGILFLQQHST
jgi:hypothetical protein